MRTAAPLILGVLLASPSFAEPVGEVSAWRIGRGMPGLVRDIVLETEAIRHARSMALSGRMDHGRFDERMRGIGRQRGAVENLAAGIEDFEVVLERWIESPPHLANLARRDLGRVGIGSAVNGAGRRYWVLIMAR